MYSLVWKNELVLSGMKRDARNVTFLKLDLGVDMMWPMKHAGTIRSNISDPPSLASFSRSLQCDLEFRSILRHSGNNIWFLWCFLLIYCYSPISLNLFFIEDKFGFVQLNNIEFYCYWNFRSKRLCWYLIMVCDLVNYLIFTDEFKILLTFEY